MSEPFPTRQRPTQRYVPAVGPRLRRLLVFLLALFAVLSANSLYLASVSVLEAASGETFQNYFYQYMFLLHVGLGLLLVVPLVAYGCVHIANAHARPNRRAVRAGYALFATALVLVASGLALSRGLPYVEVRDPAARGAAYWLHVATPLVAVWLFVLHRLAGPPIRWRAGAVIGTLSALLVIPALYLHAQDPREWNVSGPASGERYFFPSLARTTSGRFIPARALTMDGYCRECHAEIHRRWAHSVHRFASFNNPAYLFSVRNTRRFALERDGNVQASRFCAGCHDPVPFLSGAFDDPSFDDVNHPTAQAGITCSVCHAISHVNSSRGNADFTIDEPLHYPFAFSESPSLRALNRFLIKAKPALHKKTFLKPLHRTPEFCATCHKVHLPEALNGYKWLRGQNHYDSYHLSGVSGHGVESFYYPPRAVHDCNGCHMPLLAAADFGARDFDGSGELKVHDHQFPAANTAIPHLLGMPAWVNERHREMLEGSLRVDVFGVREGGTLAGRHTAALGPVVPALEPGATYLLEVVLRTLTLGHHFTQGTADSNEVWLEVEARSGGRVIGRSGALDPADGEVDPWSHFVNAYVLDRAGNRIDRRNPEDIFTVLYDHQIPPGAADVVLYRLAVPEWVEDAVDVSVKLRYRKFDTAYVRHFQGDDFVGNDLPITTIAEDRLMFPAGTEPAPGRRLDTAAWERWNDYGIGLLRKPGTGALRQAEAAFREVERLGRGEGALNLARLYLREGRLAQASDALRRAAASESPVPSWSLAYFTGIVNHQNGYFDEAIAEFESVLETRFEAARRRGFDFGQDYRLLNRLARSLLERSKLERGETRRAARERFLREAERRHRQALVYDPENAAAHYGLAQVHALLGEHEQAARHRRLHATYKPDDNARDRAVALARRKSPAADHAAEPIVIHDLARPGAYGLTRTP